METSIQKNNKGVEYLLKKDFEHAESEFRDALEKDSTNASALNNLGLLYHHKKDFKKAVESFTKAIAIQKKDTYFLNLANSQVYLKNYSEAEKNYKKCLHINADNENAKISLARFYESTGKANLSTQIWEDLVKSSTKDFFKIELAKNLMSCGKFENALSILNFLSAKSDSSVIYCYIGICEFYLKNFGLAEITFKKSLSIEPDNYEARHYLAINYLSKGEYESAIREFDFLIKMEPENVKLKLDKTSVLLNMGKHPEAMEIINAILKVQPENEKALRYKKLMEEMNHAK